MSLDFLLRQSIAGWAQPLANCEIAADLRGDLLKPLMDHVIMTENKPTELARDEHASSASVKPIALPIIARPSSTISIIFIVLGVVNVIAGVFTILTPLGWVFLGAALTCFAVASGLSLLCDIVFELRSIRAIAASGQK